MRLPGENEERRTGLYMKYMITGISLCLLLILGSVVLTNNNRSNKKKAQNKETPVIALEHGEAGRENEPEAENEEVYVSSYGRNKLNEIEKLYQENRLKASDLDFWDMYPSEPEVLTAGEAEQLQKKETEEGKSPRDRYAEAAEAELKAEEEAEQDDPSRDGKHTLLKYADGTEEWVLISPYLEKNTYDFTKLTMKADKMAYYEDGKKTSYIGVDISKYNGDVDFAALKDAGMDYAMLRLGARGYGSGQIVLDEKFTDNITKAQNVGMDIGIYFFSQAITVDEAVEEANFVIQNLANYKVTYPVAFDMEYVLNDTARIETLSREEKTTIAKAFLDTVKNAGYKPMLYGTKEWLIKQVDLTKLTGYDIWLSQQEDIPDYPYQFQMWQYTLEGSVLGVDTEVDLNISFVDYSEK